MAQAKKYTVTLTDAERVQLTKITRNYRHSTRERNRAQILLLSEQGHSDPVVAGHVGSHSMTVRNTRIKFSAQNPGLPMKSVVKRAEQANRAPRALDGAKEAQLVTIVCSSPLSSARRRPPGRVNGRCNS